nr:MFS transporter [Kibdelosporangium sp. MJ126-NF4]CEL18089.1 Major facilitator superfamily [Kibdelosporangium sp. MJ126-NF4]CTQ90682.1 Major facilitator superfamily [Kibdelosporangium sp. MJ126-NF4]
MMDKTDPDVVLDPGSPAADRTGSRRLGFVGVLLGVFMIVLDTTIVNVAVPRIQDDLSGTVTGMQWVVNGYNLLFAVLLLSSGAASDRHGGRKLYALGLVLFAAASLACGVAETVPVLIAARAAQGVGSAMMLPTALALAARLFPEPAERGRAFGQWAAVAGAATVLGPLVGGVLVDTLGWRAIFFVNIPVAIAALWLLLCHTPETPTHRHRFDLAGQGLGVIVLAAAAIALTEAGRSGWGEAVVLAGVGIAGIAAGVMVVVERRVRAPMIPPALIGSRQFAATSVIGLILSIGIYGQMFVLSLYLQDQRGLSAWVTGLAFLPFAAVTVVGPLVASKFLGRDKVRDTLLVGMIAGAVASLVLAFAGAQTPYPVVAIGLVLLGICQSAAQPAIASSALIGAPKQHTGVASGVLTAARQVGSVLGVALLGGLVGHDFEPGMHLALLIVATLFGIGALVTISFVKTHKKA